MSYRELSFLVYHLFAAVIQSGRDRAVGGRDDIGMDRGIVIAKVSPVLFCHTGHIAGEAVAIGATKSDVCIAVSAAHVLVIEYLSHELGNARQSSVGQRELAYLITAGSL